VRNAIKVAKMIRPKGVMFLGLAILLMSSSWSGSEPGQQILTAEVPLYLEEHLDDARIEGSEVPEVLPAPVEWRFDESQPDWKPVKPLEKQWKAVKTVRVDDALRLTLTPEHRADGPRLFGEIYVALPDWTLEDWAHIEITARTSDPVRRIGIDFNYTEEDNPEEIITPFYTEGDSARLIADGTVRTYSISLAKTATVRWDGPWSDLGIWVNSGNDVEEATLDILSIKIIPNETIYADAPVGVKTVERGKAHKRTLYSHAPGRVEFRVLVPQAGRFDFGLGIAKKDSPVTFRIVASQTDEEESTLFEETYADPTEWGRRSVDLSCLAGKTVTIALEADAKRAGSVAFWTEPTISGKQDEYKPVNYPDRMGIPFFTENEFKAHLEYLADDLLEGRYPGTRGGDLAALYIASQFEDAGLQPISEKDGYFQQVPLIGIATNYETLNFKIDSENDSKILIPVEDTVLYSELPQEEIHLEEELIFAGYGIDAPEYGWDDFKGVDIKDKVILVLNGTPDHEQTGFGTESSTYYFQSEYKRAVARLKGAKGCIQIHSDEISRWPFSIMPVEFLPGRCILDNIPINRLSVYGYISQPALDASLSLMGLSFKQLKQKADRRDFRPFSLGLKADINYKHKYSKFASPNVIGILPGSLSEDEAVIYMAHYDHLGIRRPVNGDNIYNGAMDNASGTAALICLARAFASRPPSKRSLIFLALASEEMGMLGSKYYVANPILPLEKTILGINMDTFHFFGRMDGFEMFPAQHTTSIPTLQKLGKELGLKFYYGRVDRGGSAFRTDHYPFCTNGVVALSFSPEGEFLDYTEEEIDKFMEGVGAWYHEPMDEIYPFWRYDGMTQNLKTLYHIGRYYANDGERPALNPENPFNAPKRIFEMLYKDAKK
jgi:hypothetical protein